jgi:hypothetical protein
VDTATTPEEAPVAGSPTYVGCVGDAMATGLAATLTAPAATRSAGRTTAVQGATLAAVTKAGDGVLPLVIGADTGVARMPAAAGGLAAAALVTTVTAMDNQAWEAAMRCCDVSSTSAS